MLASQIVREKAGVDGTLTPPLRPEANRGQNRRLQGVGGASATGAEGVGQTLWEETSERGGEQSWSREVWRLRFKCDWWRRSNLRAEEPVQFPEL